MLSGIHTIQAQSNTSVNRYTGQKSQFSELFANQIKLENTNITITHQSNDTIQPDLSWITPVVHEGDQDGRRGIYLTIDNEPVQSGEVVVYLYSGKTFLDSFLSGFTDSGGYDLIFDYTDLSPGLYQWQIAFRPYQHDPWSFLVDVEVLPHNYEVSVNLPTVLTRNEDYIFSANVKYNVTNNGSLGLDTFNPKSGPVEGLSVVTTVNYLTKDRKTNSFISVSSTDTYGNAIFRLSKKETNMIYGMIGISVSIQADKFGNGLNLSFPPNITIKGAKNNNFLADNAALLLILSFTGISSTVGYMYYLRHKPLFEGVLTGKRAGIIHKIFQSQTLLYYQLIGQNRIEDPDIEKGVVNAVPKELSEYQFLLNPIRLSIVKLLFDNMQLTSVELRDELDLTWNEYYTHTSALFKKGYIKITDQFISGKKRQIMILEPYGAEQFNKLTELLHVFLDNTKDYKEYMELASDKLIDDEKLYPIRKEE